MTGIILAGGKSSRMGEDKSFVLFSGRPLIEIVIDSLSGLFNDLIVVTNKPQLYQRYGLRTEIDAVKGRGPLAGIYTGLIFSRDDYNFITACDMPFLNRDLIRYMKGASSGYEAVIPECGGKLEPLCAVYSKSCIGPIEKQLSNDNLKITDFLRYVKVRVIKKEEFSRFDSGQTSFTNINTPDDIQRF